MAPQSLTPARRLRLSFLSLLAVFGFGVVGYLYVENWGFFDAFYMTVITLSTVGFMEVHPLTAAGRAVTIILILGGGTVAAFILRSAAEVLAGENLRASIRRYRMQHRLSDIAHHQIVCGYGRMGRVICENLRASRCPLVVIDQNEALADALEERDLLHVTGDATEDSVLLKAGIERARGLVAVAPSDAVNIFIVLSARALNPRLHIVARSEYEYEAHKLHRAGADQVVSPYVIGARRIADAVFQPAVADFLDLGAHHAERGWELEQVLIQPTAPFANRCLRDSRIREDSGCTVVALRQRDGCFLSNPDPETLLAAGDTLILLGTPAQLARIEQTLGLLRGPRATS